MENVLYDKIKFNSILFVYAFYKIRLSQSSFTKGPGLRPPQSKLRATVASKNSLINRNKPWAEPRGGAHLPTLGKCNSSSLIYSQHYHYVNKLNHSINSIIRIIMWIIINQMIPMQVMNYANNRYAEVSMIVGEGPVLCARRAEVAGQLKPGSGQVIENKFPIFFSPQPGRKLMLKQADLGT